MEGSAALLITGCVKTIVNEFDMCRKKSGNGEVPANGELSGIASFRKSETEAWHYSISNARCLFEFKMHVYSKCTVSETRISAYKESIQ